MKQMLIAASMALALAAWAPHVRAAEYPVDNTGTNVRDRSGDTLTSGDQSDNSQDIKITQQVRKAIVADGSLSMNAQNVKVITTGGVVTLRGPVNSPQEKAKITAAAERIAGVKRVDDQLEVTKQ
jgi:hyperosmotically inducible periplasmic protein